MIWVRSLVARLMTLFRFGDRYSEIHEEMSFHLEMEKEANLRTGMSGEEAERRAAITFGGVDWHRERVREAWGFAFLDDLVRDLRVGFRQLRRHPGFTVVAVSSLGLGIGATTALFSVLNGVVLQPLPYRDADRVVHLLGTHLEEEKVVHEWLAYPEVVDIRNRSRDLEGISAIQNWAPVLYGDGNPVRLNGHSVSSSFFSLLGVFPHTGRFFLPEDGELGHDPVVVLSYGLWQRAFGSDRSLLGESLNLNGIQYTVIGIAPQGFEDPLPPTQIWRSRPPGWDPEAVGRGNHSWRALGRVRKGVSIEAAQIDQDRIWAQLAEEFPGPHGREGVLLTSARDYLVGPVRSAVFLLFGAVAFVLLIACSNVANLLLNRTIVRGREVGLRASLGATRGRILLQLVTEVCLLFLLGGVVGLALAWFGTGPMVSLMSDGVPRVDQIRIDRTVLGFSLGVSLLTGLLFGLSAAFQGLGRDLAKSVGMSDRGGSGGRRGRRLRGTLIVVEVALSVVLLACGGLLLRSFLELARVEPGFDPEKVLTLRTVPPADYFPERAQVDQFYGGIIEQVSAFPGVSAVGAINLLPMTGIQNCEFVWWDALPPPQPGELDPAYQCLEVRVVTPGYFNAMGLTMLDGRGFSEADGEGALPAGILNEAAKEMMFPADKALGENVTLFETRAQIPSVSRRVVGIVGNVRHFSLDRAPVPAIYVPFAQEMDPGRRWGMTLTVRSERDPILLAGVVLPTVRAVDEASVIENVRPMSAVVGGTVAGPRFRTTLLLLFGAAGLILSAVGVAGVVGFSVARRIPEIGLRMALGARKRRIYTTVMGQAVGLTLIGMVLGTGGVYAAASALSSAGLLFEVGPYDLLVLVTAPLCLGMVAAAAIWLPARHAVRIDPVKALAAE